MANQTVTTTVNYDSDSILSLLNGESITINGGAVTIDADTRWNQQSAVFGAVTLSSTLGGTFTIDGTKIWEIPFSSSTGNVPTQASLGSNTVTGGTSGATGELTRVWATSALEPSAAGGAMPASGFIKLRSKTGTFQAGETISLPGGATIVAVDAGKRSWINVAAREISTLTIPRLGNFSITGDWYDLATTDGNDDQTIQFPIADECPAIQIETSAGSGVYEWWLNAGRKWGGYVQPASQTVSSMAEGVNVAPRPSYQDPSGFLHAARSLTEGTANAIHITSVVAGGNSIEAGIHTMRTYLKKSTRRYGFAQIYNSTDRYGIIIDFDAAGAVVANPTVGAPANASHTVLDIGGGWYRIDLTLNTTVTSGIGAIIGTSNSAAPTYTNGIPTFLGSASESIWYTELQLIAPSSLQYVATDIRGKFFFSNPQTGTIKLAQRTGLTAGFKPPAGCKIRIPNVICSNACVADYSANSVQAPLYNVGRFGFVTSSAGAIYINNAVLNWYPSVSAPFTVSIQNSAIMGAAVTSAATSQTYNNVGIGLSRDVGGGTLSLTSCPTGATMTDVRACASTMQIATITLSSCSNVTLTRVRVEAFGFSMGRLTRFGQAAQGFYVASSSNITFNDPTIVGTGFSISTSTNVAIYRVKYAELMAMATQNETGIAVYIATTCRNITVDGFDTIAGLTNVHPKTNIVQALTNCSNIVVRNIGTPSAPFNGGSANQLTTPVNFAGSVFTSSARRIYTENITGPAVGNTATNDTVEWVNCWGDGADAQTVVGRNILAKGCRWSNNNTVQNAVYGVHWEDAFTGTTSGRITIFGNEPLAATVDQCSTSFGTNAGFTSAGNAAMPNLGDSITWTMPYYALGHTGISQYSYGVSSTETWLFTGTNPQNYEFEYQIDTGSGVFSAWKWLLSIARQSSGGASGTNSITMTIADIAAMTRRPQVGDYLQSTNARIPVGTTITNVSGADNNVLTLSNNFSSSMSASELVYFWREISSETISPTTGYKLKVKTRTNTANANNLFSFLRIPFDTTASAQQTQYALPGSSLTVNGLVANSRVKVSRTDTGAFLAQSQTAGTSILFDLPYEGSVTIEARNASGATAYKPWQAQVIVSNTTPASITALQEVD